MNELIHSHDGSTIRMLYRLLKVKIVLCSVLQQNRCFNLHFNKCSVVKPQTGMVNLKTDHC